MQETQNTGGNPRPKSSNLAIGILAAIVVVLLVIWFQSSQSPTDNETGPVADDSTTADETMTTGSSYAGLIPEAWTNYDTAIVNIQTLGVGQEINGFIVEDPTENDIVYFSTSAYNTDIDENLVSIYRYNESNDNFERLFRTRYRRGATSLLAETMVPKMLTVGYEDGNLVLLMMDMEDELDTCEHALLTGTGDDRGDARNLLSMNIESPYDGFDEYLPSDEQVMEAEAIEKDCQ